MSEIIRDPTSEELRTYIDVPLDNASGRVLTPRDKFNKKLAGEEQKAVKKRLPFAAAAARADVKDIVDSLNKKLKRQGYIEDDYELPDVDWSKYSNLKNFEVIDQGVESDLHLSKIHRLPVFVKYTKYRFKGYSNTYTVMEGEDEAVQRAQYVVDNRQVVDKNVKEKESEKGQTRKGK